MEMVRELGGTRSSALLGGARWGLGWVCSGWVGGAGDVLCCVPLEEGSSGVTDAGTWVRGTRRASCSLAGREGGRCGDAGSGREVKK